MLPEEWSEVLRKEHLFQWAPTLGGECYGGSNQLKVLLNPDSFNGHPSLGVNATGRGAFIQQCPIVEFQWAPTLGGECYYRGTVPQARLFLLVSMGTHPWG